MTGSLDFEANAGSFGPQLLGFGLTLSFQPQCFGAVGGRILFRFGLDLDLDRITFGDLRSLDQFNLLVTFSDLAFTAGCDLFLRGDSLGAGCISLCLGLASSV